jgi:very-short-patch-repair endonuclease
VDAAYPESRVGVLYEGEHHLTPWQQSTDMERDAQCSEAGWILIKANRHDLRNGFARTVSRVRNALVRRGAVPGNGVVRPASETPHQDMP